jgi:outer membrane receptor protein involved in Fe transport
MYLNKSLLGPALTLVLMVATVLPQETAFAQTTNESGALEEIVVTARKREERLQDVPVSISAFSADDIAEYGVNDISKLSDFAPNFSYETFGGRIGAEGDTARPVIRGQSNILGEGNASFFVDGIPYSESILSFPIEAVERVEIIKGPQAALFGRSTFAGAINLITKRGTNDFRNTASLRLASDDDYEVNLSSSGPLSEDKVFYFIHGRYYDYGGQYTNELDGTDVGQEQSFGINAALEFKAGDNLTIIARGGYNEDDDGLPAQRVQDRFSNNCFLDQARQYYCGEVTEFKSVVLAKDRLLGEEGLRREVARGSLSIEWDIGGNGFLLTSNSGFVDSDYTFGNDQTNLGDPINFAGGSFVRVEESERDEWSTELRLDSPQNQKFRYLIGAYYYERDRERIRRFPGTQTLIADFGKETVENFAVFGAIEFDFGEAWTARAELRQQTDEIGLLQASGTQLTEEFDSTLPRVTVDYRMTENSMLYFTVAKGNKPGVFNSNPILPASARLADEEEAWNYEIGTKWDSSDRRSRVNAAVFFIDWSNQQLSNSILVGGVPISFISNAGKTEVWGIDLEGSRLLTDNWELYGSFGYSNAEFIENCDPVQGSQLTGFDCVSPTGIDGGDVSGNQTPNSPESQFALGTKYTHSLTGEMDLVLRGDYSYRSKVYSQVHNLAHTGDRQVLNLKAGFQTDNWRVTLFVDNVLDDLTPSTVVRFADLGNLNIGPNPDPEQDNIPGSTVVERGFLVPLADGRSYGLIASIEF